MGMRVHYRSRLASLFLPRRYLAITLGSHVLTRESRLDESVLRHERAHVEQWSRHGRMRFLARYLWYQLRYGYEGNPFELEARSAEWEAFDGNDDEGGRRACRR
jgi:hypothetical protein